MTAPDLTAFIPVDRAVALKRNPKDPGRCRRSRCYRRLLEKCSGRVVRSDLGWAANAVDAANQQVEKAFVDIASDEEWKTWAAAQKAAKHVTVGKLFIDYVLH